MHNIPSWFGFVVMNAEWIAGFLVGLVILGIASITWKALKEDKDETHRSD